MFFCLTFVFSSFAFGLSFLASLHLSARDMAAEHIGKTKDQKHNGKNGTKEVQVKQHMHAGRYYCS